MQGKISWWENWDLLKKHKEKVKIRIGNATGKTYTKSTKTGEKEKR